MSKIESLSPEYISGVGTINLNSKVINEDITLSQASDLIFSEILNSENQNITINTDLHDRMFELIVGF